MRFFFVGNCFLSEETATLNMPTCP